MEIIIKYDGNVLSFDYDNKSYEFHVNTKSIIKYSYDLMDLIGILMGCNLDVPNELLRYYLNHSSLELDDLLEYLIRKFSIGNRSKSFIKLMTKNAIIASRQNKTCISTKDLLGESISTEKQLELTRYKNVIKLLNCLGISMKIHTKYGSTCTDTYKEPNFKMLH